MMQLAACAANPVVPLPSSAAAAEPTSGASQAPASPTFEDSITAGDQAWGAGQLDKAIYQYVLALQRSPQHAPTLAKIGAIEEGRGNLPKARRAFEMAHAAQPDEPRMAERLGRIYLQQGEIDKASEVFVHVLALHPSRARALDGMGEVFRRQGKLREALLCFDQALKAEDVDAAEVRTHRGYARLLANDVPGAREDLREALAQRMLPETWVRLADLQARQYDLGGALKSLVNVMGLAEAYNQVGLTLLQIKDYQLAAECFSKAINANPAWFEEANRNLALANEYLKRAPG